MVSLVTSVLHNVLTPVKDVTMSMVYVTEDVIQAGKGTIAEIVNIVMHTDYTWYVFYNLYFLFKYDTKCLSTFTKQ